MRGRSEFGRSVLAVYIYIYWHRICIFHCISRERVAHSALGSSDAASRLGGTASTLHRKNIIEICLSLSTKWRRVNDK